MQATNKSDATQVYESAVKSSRTGAKGTLKYILKPLTIFGYHYFIEGIRAVQKDGPTKELEKITNLSYEETIKVMEKCQQDGVRVVATERTLSKENSEFGKKKSLYQQKKITKYARRMKHLSNFKSDHPKVAKILQMETFIKRNEAKQKEEQIKHKDRHYNVYFNKSKRDYMAARIADVIELRTGISQKLFDEITQKAIENFYKESKTQLNSQQLEDFSKEFKLHEIGNVEPEKFKKDYCIHELPFNAYMSIKDDLEVADIQYGARVTKDNNDKEIKDIAPTQTTNCGSSTSSAAVLISENGSNYLKIRKLTPLECWRLMGFDDEDFYKAKNVGISDTQLYRQAGNSIVVNVLEEIFKTLLNLKLKNE